MSIEDDAKATPQPKPRGLARRIAITLAILVGVLASLVGLVVLVADAMDIEPFVQQGHAMVPSLPAGTRFLRVPFRGRPPAPGEMIIMRDAFSGGQIVRRVIGVAGDRIDFDGFAPRVNGRAIGREVACPSRLHGMVCMREHLGDEAWTAAWSRRAHPGEAHVMPSVPHGFVYLLSDHRDIGRDSRDALFGATPIHAVVGYVVPVR